MLDLNSLNSGGSKKTVLKNAYYIDLLFCNLKNAFQLFKYLL